MMMNREKPKSQKRMSSRRRKSRVEGCHGGCMHWWVSIAGWIAGQKPIVNRFVSCFKEKRVFCSTVASVLILLIAVISEKM